MWWRRPRSVQDFAEEVQAHLALEADRLMAEGMSPDEARSAAHRRFGNVTRVQERFYEQQRWPWLDQAIGDARGALRAMTRYPAACFVAILSLSAGIGSAAIVLVMRDTIFHNPPPLYAQPSELSRVTIVRPDDGLQPVAAGLFQAWLPLSEAIAELGAATRAVPADVRLPDRIETVLVRRASPNLFRLLGVDAAFGRTLDDTAETSPATPTRQANGDSGPGGTPEATPVVLSHHLWHTLFGASPDALGASIIVDDVPHTVVGVMPERFWFSSTAPSLWTPLDWSGIPPTPTVNVVARRRGDTTPAALQERLQAMAADYIDSLPPDQRQLRVQVRAVGGTPLGDNVGPIPIVLLGTAVLLTLLIACANVAILMIAQWTARERETAIRASLGGSRGRLVRALVTESILIAAAGGSLGLAVTFALRGLLIRQLPHAALYDLSVDPRVLFSTMAITLMAGLLTGLMPALYETKRLQANPLGLMRAGDRVRQRWRHALVAFEIAVTVALLVVTGALLSAYGRVMSASLGFDPSSLVTIRVENSQGVPAARIVERLMALSGVVGAAASTAVPMTAQGPQQTVAVDAAGTRAVKAEAAHIGSGFFETLGVPLRAGRDFAAADAAGAARVAIVNEVLASLLWPQGGATGEMLWIEGIPHQVAGVVAGYADNGLQRPRRAFYLPMRQQTTGAGRMQFLARTAGNAGALAESARRAIRDAGPGNAVTMVTPLDQLIAVWGQEILLSAYPMTPLIATGLLLTGAGIYGVLAFAVARRSSELAVRMAVGASRGQLLRLIVLQSLRLGAIGIAIGIGAAFALTRIAQGTGSVFDSPGWRAFVIPIAIVAAIAAVAAWIPSRRAMRVEPASLLRST